MKVYLWNANLHMLDPLQKKVSVTAMNGSKQGITAVPQERNFYLTFSIYIMCYRTSQGFLCFNIFKHYLSRGTSFDPINIRGEDDS